VDRILYFIDNYNGLSTTTLLSGSYTEPAVNVTVADGTSTAGGSGSGYFAVAACNNPSGFGYYNGIAQKCPQGFYNSAGSNDPCKQ
jgi:hypothetical protein